MVITYSLVFIMVPVMAMANKTITQTIHLKAGWNSIFLEVIPDEPDPDILFKDSPITQVLTIYTNESSVEFIEDPDEVSWKSNTWFRWIPSNAPEALLKTLHALNENQGYIIYSNDDYTLNIDGQPYIRKRQWQPDAYNLVGFFVDPVAPPTFAQYFAGSKSHENLRVFTLIDGIWRQIEKPELENITSGKAYWVYCEGGSDYSGPLQIKLPGANDYLNFGRTITEWEIDFANRSPNPLSFSVTPVSNDQDNETVPLSTISYTKITLKVYEPFTHTTSPIVMEAGQSVQFGLSVRRNMIQTDSVSSLIKISDDLGNRFFVPVTADK